jgi:phosphomannomutase
MRRFRESSPSEIAGFKVEEAVDLERGTDDLPASNVLVYRLEGMRRIIMRPSGTEPKLKCYYEVCEPVREGESVADAMDRARIVVNALCEEHQAALT